MKRMMRGLRVFIGLMHVDEINVGVFNSACFINFVFLDKEFDPVNFIA